MPETGSTEEFALVERDQTSTSSEAAAPVVKGKTGSRREAPAPEARAPTPGAGVAPASKVEAPSDMTSLVHSLSEFAAETGRADLASASRDAARGCSIPTCG